MRARCSRPWTNRCRSWGLLGSGARVRRPGSGSPSRSGGTCASHHRGEPPPVPLTRSGRGHRGNPRPAWSHARPALAQRRRSGRAVSTEALVLAVVSVVRPTTAAAVWAMLVGARPRRLLGAYLLAGMAVSLTVGVAVVLLTGGALSRRETPRFQGRVWVALGIVSLLVAVAFWLGWVRRFRP